MTAESDQRGAERGQVSDGYDDWDGTVDDDTDDEPEWEAESDCVECGGQGGWLGIEQGRDVWVWCDCVTFLGEQI